MIAEADDRVTEIAFQYGRNIGLAFQLVDDMLDFVSSAETMGKPTAADLKLGLATAPVLFACEKVFSILLFWYFPNTLPIELIDVLRTTLLLLPTFNIWISIIA